MKNFFLWDAEQKDRQEVCFQMVRMVEISVSSSLFTRFCSIGTDRSLITSKDHMIKTNNTKLLVYCNSSIINCS